MMVSPFQGVVYKCQILAVSVFLAITCTEALKFGPMF